VARPLRVLFPGALYHVTARGNERKRIYRDTNDYTSFCHLNGCYTQAFNRRHRRCGHLFQGRYKAVLVEKEAHLLSLVRYLALNPLRASLCERPGDWPPIGLTRLGPKLSS
jgi:REP element-mobilizing transposase RayT